ncbi:MAG TPA: TetR/AcrR family transcriptional regulator [Acetobacteraceae bacterium]|nr:TetR/AcrR family transcriptional regulator [Acetobacteraceae bacterium]
MRTSAERKADTRERILAAAGELFRLHGIDGVGVDAIMHRAGLTHGGFYAHFASKEALVAEVFAASLARSADRWERLSREADPAGALSKIVRNYLDPAHVAALEGGCVLPTLGPDIARRTGARPTITASIERMVDALTRCRQDGQRAASLASLSTLVGAVVLARLCDDPQLAEEFLAAAEGAAAQPE